MKCTHAACTRKCALSQTTDDDSELPEAFGDLDPEILKKMKKNPQFRRGVKAGYFANYDPSELRCNVFSEGVDIGDDLWFRFSPLTHSQRRELIERLRSKKKFRIRFVDLTKVPPQTAAPLSVSWEAEVLGADFISRLHLTAIAAQC